MISLDVEKLETARELLRGAPHLVGKAAQRALSRAGTAGRTAVVREMKGRYTVDAGRVRKSMRVFAAKGGAPEVRIESRGRLMPLIHFWTAPRDVPQTRGIPVSGRTPTRVQAKRTGWKPLRTGFLARMGSGHLGVFFRTGEKVRSGRGVFWPMRQAMGPSIPEMMGSAEVVRVVERRISEAMDRTFSHEIQRALGAGG